MKLPFQSKPQTLIDRARAAGEDAIELVKSAPDRVQNAGKQGIAVAGAATGVVAGLAFWRRGKGRSDPQPSPARPVAPSPPVDDTPAKKPVTSTKAAAANAAGTRSK